MQMLKEVGNLEFKKHELLNQLKNAKTFNERLIIERQLIGCRSEYYLIQKSYMNNIAFK